MIDGWPIINNTNSSHEVSNYTKWFFIVLIDNNINCKQ